MQIWLSTEPTTTVSSSSSSSSASSVVSSASCCPDTSVLVNHDKSDSSIMKNIHNLLHELPNPSTNPISHQRLSTNIEDPKPNYSYIGLISMAILSTREKKMVLSDIYQWIQDHYSYFHSRGPGWRNSIRHNLSLNDCFVKVGRSSNGKGHYWTIHPANLEDFKRGDFRRRRAQRKVRKSMGLTCPDDDDTPSNTPVGSPQFWTNTNNNTAAAAAAFLPSTSNHSNFVNSQSLWPAITYKPLVPATSSRTFDIDSLLSTATTSIIPSYNSLTSHQHSLAFNHFKRRLLSSSGFNSAASSSYQQFIQHLQLWKFISYLKSTTSTTTTTTTTRLQYTNEFTQRCGNFSPLFLNDLMAYTKLSQHSSNNNNNISTTNNKLSGFNPSNPTLIDNSNYSRNHLFPNHTLSNEHL